MSNVTRIRKSPIEHVSTMLPHEGVAGAVLLVRCIDGTYEAVSYGLSLEEQLAAAKMLEAQVVDELYDRMEGVD